MKYVKVDNDFENMWCEFEYKKRCSILRVLKNTMSTMVLCMTKDFNNILKLFQIHGILIPCINKNNCLKWIVIP